MTIQEKIAEEYKTTSTLTEEEVATLEKLYYLTGRYQVLGFIEKNSFLVPLLLEAPGKIKKFFPNSPLFLKLVADPEEINQVELVIFIGTNHNSDEAFNKLDQLEEDWWLDTLIQARCKLSIMTKYL
jgi:hypothetical protein